MEEDQIIQLTVVGLMALILFVGAYVLPQTAAARILIILAPFQVVETQFATANVIITWVIFIAMIMRGQTIRLALLPQILVLLFVYFLSFAMQHEDSYVQHAIYMFNLVTAFLVLWIVYDFTIRVNDINKVVQVFLLCNVLVAVYCAVQMTQGPGTKYVFLGIEEIAMMPIVKDYRLTGPFGGAGIIAEYLVIMIFFCIHQLLNAHSNANRRIALGLVFLNLILLMATGNRGGFLTLIGGGILFLYLFRHVLGTKRTITVAATGLVTLSLAAAISINFTQYNVLFDRLAETELEAGIPDTRQRVWPMAIAEIKNKPLLGHGPRLRFIGDDDGEFYEGHPYIPFPHNLYLYLLFTVGSIGLIVFMAFLLTPLIRCWRLSSRQNVPVAERTFLLTGVVLIVVLLIDQLKIEFMRVTLTDYWHFLFALFGVLIAACDIVANRSNVTAENNAKSR